MKIVAVIPAYNEASVITEVVKGVRQVVTEVVVVDDGSHDHSGALARAAGAIVLRHLVNRGQGAALETGMRFALRQGADIIIHFDADGQHDPRDIPSLIAPIIKKQAEVVLGSRFLAHDSNVPFVKKYIILKLGLYFTRIFSGLKLTDVHNGLRAFSREAALQIRTTHDDMAHASEILDIIADKKLSYLEVPATIRYTSYSLARGQGSMNGLTIVRRLIIDKFFTHSR